MPARQYKSIKVKEGYSHREHRSSRGRKWRNSTWDWKKAQKEIENKKTKKKISKYIIKIKQKYNNDL